jgi:cyanophycinase
MELSTSNPLISTFAKLAGGKSGTITVLPIASDYGKEIGPLYTEVFNKFAKDVEYYVIDKRKDIESSQLLDRIKSSSGIFFTGGNQLRITTLIGGSEVMRVLRNMDNQSIIAGTSAGASAMSSTMISWGRADVMVKGNLQMSPGMGLIRKMVIDSHFVKRGRISRLFHVVSQNPGILGIGLAEDTGILFDKAKNHSFEIIGSRQVIVVDGRDIDHTNIAQLAEKMPFSVTNIRVHSLGPNYSYNFDRHEIIIPPMIDDSSTDAPPTEISDLPYKPGSIHLD